MPEILPSFCYLSYSGYTSSSNLLPTYLTWLVFKPVTTVIQKHSCGSEEYLHCAWSSGWWTEFSGQLYKAPGLTHSMAVFDKK